MTNYRRGHELEESQASQVAYYRAKKFGTTPWIELTLPYSLELSKNHIYGRGSKGHTYVRGTTRRAMEQIERVVKLGGTEWYQTKIWVEICVFRPDKKADAINFVDAICDALQRAIGVNDRWFAIHRVDWTMDKNAPRIEVRVWPDTEDEREICSTCGLNLPATSFWKNQGSCKSCGKKAQRLRAEKDVCHNCKEAA